MYVSPHMTQFLFKITPPYCTVHSTVLRILYVIQHTCQKYCQVTAWSTHVTVSMEFYLIPILDTNIWFNYSRILGLSVPLWPPPLVPQFWRKTLLPQSQHPITFIMQSAVFHSTVNPSSPLLRIFVCVFCLSLKFVHLNVFQCLSVLLSVCLSVPVNHRPSIRQSFRL